MSAVEKVEIVQEDPAFLPETGFVRLKTVLKLIPVGKSTWFRWIADGKAPRSVKLSEATTAWKAEDIRALIEKLGSQNDD